MALMCSFRNQLKVNKLWLPLFSGTRTSIFPASYREPINSKEELAALEASGELEKIRGIPVKPALADTTFSIYDDPMVKKFTNMVMQWGNRALAKELMRDTFGRIKRIQIAKYHAAKEEDKASVELDPKVIFLQAVENCKPVLNVTGIRKGGILYQVPVPITAKFSRFMAMKWLVLAARDKDGPISFVNQMSKELLDAYHNEGRVVKRKQDLHKLCENNKAYAHYRWS